MSKDSIDVIASYEVYFDDPENDTVEDYFSDLVKLLDEFSYFKHKVDENYRIEEQSADFDPRKASLKLRGEKPSGLKSGGSAAISDSNGLLDSHRESHKFRRVRVFYEPQDGKKGRINLRGENIEDELDQRLESLESEYFEGFS